MTKLNLPKNMQFIDHGNYLEIVRVWRGRGTLYWAGFTVVYWVALSWGFYEYFPSWRDSWNPSNLSEPWEEFVGWLVGVVGGISLTYHALANFFNKTYIFANESKIEIRHRPVPWIGNLKVDATDINQLYVKEVVHQEEGGTRKDYELRAKSNSGKDIKILSDLPDADQAEFVEERLKALLHIENQPVRGEYR